MKPTNEVIVNDLEDVTTCKARLKSIWNNGTVAHYIEVLSVGEHDLSSFSTPLRYCVGIDRNVSPDLLSTVAENFLERCWVKTVFENERGCGEVTTVFGHPRPQEFKLIREEADGCVKLTIYAGNTKYVITDSHQRMEMVRKEYTVRFGYRDITRYVVMFDPATRKVKRWIMYNMKNSKLFRAC